MVSKLGINPRQVVNFTTPDYRFPLVLIQIFAHMFMYMWVRRTNIILDNNDVWLLLGACEEVCNACSFLLNCVSSITTENTFLHLGNLLRTKLSSHFWCFSWYSECFPIDLIIKYLQCHGRTKCQPSFDHARIYPIFFFGSCFVLVAYGWLPCFIGYHRLTFAIKTFLRWNNIPSVIPWWPYIIALRRSFSHSLNTDYDYGRGFSIHSGIPILHRTSRIFCLKCDLFSFFWIYILYLTLPWQNLYRCFLESMFTN